MIYHHEIKFIHIVQLEHYRRLGWYADYVRSSDHIIRIRRLVAREVKQTGLRNLIERID